MKHVGDAIVILLLYVVDIIVTESATLAISEIIQALATKFNLLKKIEMHESKSCATPCLPSHRLLKNYGVPYNNLELYRSVVGLLQYLTFTRPYIAFSIHQVCQFMYCPMESHFLAMKRILRYLKGT